MLLGLSFSPSHVHLACNNVNFDAVGVYAMWAVYFIDTKLFLLMYVKLEMRSLFNFYSEGGFFGKISTS